MLKLTPHQNKILEEAAEIYSSQLTGQKITNVAACQEYVQGILFNKPEEHFMVIYLSNNHQVITHEILFNGSISEAAVYPRVIARKCLEHNAAAVILAHNHPSGDNTPSQADRVITQRVKEVLALLDIRVLDHLIVGYGEIVSLAEQGEV